MPPLWYPPPRDVTANPGLARALEMGLWFAYFTLLVKLPPVRQMGAHQSPFENIDYGPMYKRFRDLGWEPTAVFELANWPGGPGRKPILAPKGSHYDALKRLNAYGIKHKQLDLRHRYPEAVKLYIVKTQEANFFAAFFRGQKQLPSSDLSWASTSI